MTDDPGNFNSTPFDSLKRYIPLAIWAIVILVVVVIPFKIVSYGYLPGDDALRHAAKAVSGKPWQEILVLGDSFKIDHNLGWHLFLRQIYLWTKCGAEGLVVFSVVALFLLAIGSALPWLKRPEAWLISFLLSVMTSDTAIRFMLGRPFLLTIFGTMTILFAWQAHGSSPPKWRMVLWMTPLIALCIFIHGVWYLWVLPIAAFFFAGQFRWGLMLGVSWIAGTILGASLTGHPIDALEQAVIMAQRAFALHDTQRTLVTEFQPSPPDILALIIFGGLVILRQLSGIKWRPLTGNPAFWLAFFGWVLSFKAGRFADWGHPALMVLVACDLDLFLQSRMAADSFKRLVLVCCVAATTFLATTSDVGSRWTNSLTWQFLTPDNPDLKGWLPEKEGILYSVDMNIFYQTFYKNPNADWRYILGYEPALMSDEDFKVYQDVLWNFGDPRAYQPWVDKMRLQDRLVIRNPRSSPPAIPQLEWNYGVSDIWIGRLPQTNAPPIHALAPR
jgi:hypothetical protein